MRFSTVQSLTFARMLFKGRTEVPSGERKHFKLRFVIASALPDRVIIFYCSQLLTFAVMLSKAQTEVISSERKRSD